MTLENPLESVPAVLEDIREFGNLAGFKLNKQKTAMLVKNMDCPLTKHLERTSDIKSEKKVKYLEIWLTANNNNIFNDNCVKVWKEIKKDMQI